jgi:hypothetical protein
VKNVFLAPPQQAPTWAALASTVPVRCPFHGCDIANVTMIGGGHDRAPVIDVTYRCRRTITIPVRAT